MRCRRPIPAATSAPTTAGICSPRNPSPRIGRHVRRGLSVSTILVSLLIVALATIAVASTLLAMKLDKDKTRAEDDYARASRALEQYVVTVATSSNLKGSSHEAGRRELIEQALGYYQGYVQSHQEDPQPSLQVAAAQFTIAGLQAKLGSPESVVALMNGVGYLDRLNTAKIDPREYPSLQQCALRITVPTDWVTVKGGDLNQHVLGLVLALQNAIITFDKLSQECPQAIGIRDDLSAVLAASATLQSAIGSRRANALNHWSMAIPVLESLVNDQPANKDYKNRLCQSLEGAAKLHKADGDFDKAVTLYQKAVEVREQLSAANPDDAALAKDVATVKSDLEKLQTAAAQKKEAPPATAEAKGAPPAEAQPDPPAETPAQAEAQDAPAPEAKDASAAAAP